MALRHTSHQHPLEQLRGEVDRLLSGFTGSESAGPWSLPGRGELAANVWETAEAVFIELEVPGTTSDQLELSVVANELTVKVHRPEVEEEGATYHRRERPAGLFTRVMRLPVQVDGDRVQAELRGGVLTVTLPKAETARPRKIRVLSNGQ